ncbi:MAG: hypothetical protein O2900_04650 [Proteobacteria bacterium]|nr:hypothetical protein [Pseudomonadota bacterium]
MTETITLNQARLQLGIGKEKLKRLLVLSAVIGTSNFLGTRSTEWHSQCDELCRIFVGAN